MVQRCIQLSKLTELKLKSMISWHVNYISLFLIKEKMPTKTNPIKCQMFWFTTNIWLRQGYVLSWLKASHLLILTLVYFISLNVHIYHPHLSGWWKRNLCDIFIMFCGLQIIYSSFLIWSLISLWSVNLFVLLLQN